MCDKRSRGSFFKHARSNRRTRAGSLSSAGSFVNTAAIVACTESP